ncbi:hypothetical protein KIF24_24035 [Micromonospora sp. Llam7]|uniref:hypothetical protein n=1 Tax=Micromonospora tarapacensis TaxID=2835305 RepID=UPI001C82AF59|nr:hypothetical protein [Micromonospora tarapacensis]MBX7268783.1 hypothetical protein [Micromonospora tarapacensis]
MVVARLPAGCGRAFARTSEQLAAHEAAAPSLSTRWPVFTAELAAALRAEGEEPLAEQVGRLRVVQTCGCRDDFCRSFRTAPKPDGAYGDGHRNVCLDAPWPSHPILDVVHDEIRYVEVLY